MSIRVQSLPRRVDETKAGVLYWFRTELGLPYAQPFLERIRKQLARNKEFSKSGVTTSIGAITYNAAPQVVDDMIARADETMYRVKGGSKSRVPIEIAQAA